MSSVIISIFIGWGFVVRGTSADSTSGPRFCVTTKEERRRTERVLQIWCNLGELGYTIRLDEKTLDYSHFRRASSDNSLLSILKENNQNCGAIQPIKLARR